MMSSGRRWKAIYFDEGTWRYDFVLHLGCEAFLLLDDTGLEIERMICG
jgi:hypothetical protein